MSDIIAVNFFTNKVSGCFYVQRLLTIAKSVNVWLSPAVTTPIAEGEHDEKDRILLEAARVLRV